MAEWWEAAPLAQQAAPAQGPAAGANWWDAAPLAGASSVENGRLNTVKVTPAQGTQPQAPAEPSVSMSDAMGRGAAQGLSLNFYDELRGLVEAGGANPRDPASLGKLLQGAYKYWSGDKEAEKRYDETAARERATTKQVETERPNSYLAGNVAGAVALPVGAMANAATLPARIGRGAMVGAGTGALAGAGEGVGLTDSLKQAAIGGAIGTVAGGAAPVALQGIAAAGRGIGRAAEPLMNTVRGFRDPESEAARRVTASIARDYRNGDPGLAGREFRDAAASGQPVNVMDLGGETTRALARSSANSSPEGRAVLGRSIDDRFEGQGDRLTGWLNNTFHYPNADAQQQAIENVSRTVNRANYARAHAEPRAQAMWDEGFEQLMQAPVVQEAARKATTTGANRAATEGFTPVRRPFEFHDVESLTPRYTRRADADGNTISPNLQFWDHVKRNMDDKISSLQRAGENSAARDAQQLRAHLVNHLDELVPTYRTARAGAASFFGAENALEAGQNFVGAAQKFGIPETRRALARMSPQERQLFQDGYVSRLVETINSKPDRRNVLNSIAQSPAARSELELAMGRNRWHEMEAMLRVEGVMDLARNAVQGNSTTARQLIEAGLAGGAGYGVTTGDYNPKSLLTAAFVGSVARGAAGKLNQRIDTRVARQVADMLTSNDPRVLQNGMRILARHPRMLDNLRSADNALARVSGEQAGGVPALQSVGTGRADEQQPNVQRPQ